MIESIIGVVFTFGIIVFIHEFGHFILCRLLGVSVEEFSFGFGKAIYKKEKNGTVYAIRIVPLGGYVKPKGEDISEWKGEGDEYFSKKWYERMMIVLAGPFMNYILSFLVFFLVIVFVGKPVPSDLAIIGDVAQGLPADIAGIKPGDKIVSINGNKVEKWYDLVKLITPKINEEISIEYERDGKRYNVSVRTKLDPALNRGIIGIAPVAEYEKVSFFEAIKLSFNQIVHWTTTMFMTIVRSIYHREKPDVAGPIGIVQVVSKASHGDISDFFFLLGLISIAVGFFNLLPLPMLDGGHFLLYFFEWVFSLKITPRIMRYVNSTGIVILMSILIFATYNDVKRIYDTAKTKTYQQSNK